MKDFLLILMCILSFFVIDMAEEERIENQRLQLELNSYKKKLTECDYAYTRNKTKLDSVNKANFETSARVRGYLHDEYRYQKQFKNK
jgi:GTPase involved in cell partitioning and DNA repair